MCSLVIILNSTDTVFAILRSFPSRLYAAVTSFHQEVIPIFGTKKVVRLVISNLASYNSCSATQSIKSQRCERICRNITLKHKVDRFRVPQFYQYNYHSKSERSKAYITARRQK